MNMFLISIKRRKQEIRYVMLVTFLASFFMAGILLFQGIMNRYILEQNYQNYGNWIVAAADEELSHPYFQSEGSCTASVRLLDEEGKKTGFYLGAMDEKLIELGNIRLYEGRMPQAADEAAMDLSSLAAFGYSYELGQEITVRWQEGGKKSEIHEKTYRLVGTLYGYSTAWKSVSDYPMPEILVTEEEAASYPRMHTIYYYQLDPDYEEINTEQFAKFFREEHKTATYNSYVYENQMWGTTGAFERVSVVMIVLAAAAVSYLLASYASKRRPVYYRYRCMGAGLGQVRKMILVEFLYAVVPPAIAGLALACLSGYGGSLLLSRKQELPALFVWDGTQFLKQVGTIALVLLVSIGWNMIQIRDKKLAQRIGTIPVRKLSVLRKAAVKTKHPQKDFIRRYNRLHRLSWRVALLFTVLISSFLVLCSNQLNRLIMQDIPAYQEMNDFSFSLRLRYEDSVTGASYENYSACFGLEQEELDELESIWGVQSVETRLMDRSIHLNWEGKEESQLLRHMRDVQSMDEGTYNIMFHFLPDSRTAKELLKSFDYNREIDWVGWENGELVLVFIKTNFTSADGFCAVSIVDETMEDGEILELIPFHGEHPVSVTAADVCFLDNSGSEALFAPYYEGAVTVFGSEQLAHRLTASDGTKVKANFISGQFDQYSSFESTDKQLAQFASVRSLNYTSGAEGRRTEYQRILRDFGIYGMLFLLVLAVYVILQKNFSDSRNWYRKEQYLLFRKIGMEKRTYLRIVMKEAVREYLWIAAGIPGGYALDGYVRYQEMKRYPAGYSILTGAATEDMRLLTLEDILFHLNHVWTIVLILGVMGILLCSCYRSTKRYMEKRVKEGDGR
ncbi:MAG: hypothetical protein IJ468_14050 [Lachnospiraceae bacterium]|nr:hypothetical protein [Lachnospiraceae bacterium]